MDVYQTTARRARRFGQSYPAELPDRLEWWASELGLDRTHLLRLVGMSVRQAAKVRAMNLAAVVTDPEWEANARGLEENLVWLLSLVGYDLDAMVKYLHQPAAPSAEKDPLEESVRRMHHGGPDVLLHLINSLVAVRNGAGVPGAA